jgi:hypothetical protein
VVTGLAFGRLSGALPFARRHSRAISLVPDYVLAALGILAKATAHRQRTASSFPIGAAWLQRADHGARPKRASRYPTGCRPCPRDHGVAGADREPAILRNFARQSAD